MISSFCSNKLWEPVITGVICSLGLAWRLHYSDQSWGDSVVSGACPDCLALCITLVLLVAKHHHWQTVTRLNYFYGYSPTRNVGSIFQMMGIWCGSIILNKTDLIWNWICLFQFCFEARVDIKGGEREGGGKPLFLEQRSVVSPPSGVSTHMMRWHGGHPGTLCHCPSNVLGLNSFLFQLKKLLTWARKCDWHADTWEYRNLISVGVEVEKNKSAQVLISIKISVSFQFLTGADFK